MSESNNNIPMRITQLEEAETFDYESYLAEAKAGSGTKKVKGSTLLSELIDVRQGADGVTYPSAGDAVRNQVEDINNYLQEFEKQQSGKVNGLVIFDNYDKYYINRNTIVDTPNHFKCTEMLLPSNIKEFQVTFNENLSSNFKVIMILDQDKNLLNELAGGTANTTYTINIKNYPTAVYAQINYFNDVYYNEIKINFITNSSEKDIDQIKYALTKNGSVIECGFTYGKYIRSDGVKADIDTKWGVSTPIHLYPYDQIYLKCSSYLNAVSVITECDEIGDNLIPKVISNGSELQEYSYIATKEEYVVITVFFMFDWNVCVSNSITTNNIDNWENIKWLMVGDSLTEKNIRATTSYYDYISKETGIKTINKGKSGKGYKRELWFYNALSTVGVDDFDICTFFGSGNDIYHVVNGEIVIYTDEEWESVLGDINDTGFITICGCINETFDRFIELFPLKKFGVITPTPWVEFYDTSINSLIGSKMDDYTNAIIQICRKRGIPYLDLFHESGLRPWNSNFRNEYYTENGVADRGVHPNSKGHKWIYEIIEKFLKQFLVN